MVKGINIFDENDFLMAEVKENDENFTQCEEAKAKELNNFDQYQVYKEVPYVGQKILSSRFVLTEKSDGSIKARLVVKGFQEEDIQQSDSPTVSRDSLKISFFF